MIGGIGYSGIDYGSYHVTTFDITIYQEDGTTINNYYASNNGTAYTNLGISTGSIIYHYFDIPIYGKTVRFWPRGYSGQGNCQYGLIFGAGEVTEKFTNVTNKAVKEPNLHIKNNLNIINPDSNAGERNSSGSWSDSHNWQMLDENRGSAAWAGPNKPPLTSDFIEIQLNNPLTITGVVTQSRGHYDQYILKFYIDYWDENNNEISDYYTGFNTFIDRSTKTYHYFTKPVVAYKIRLRPGTSTNDYLTHPSIRWGLFQEGINFIGKWEDRNEDTTANRQALYKRSLLRPHTNIKSNNVISDSILSYITNNDVSEWNNNYYIANDSNFDKTNTIIKTIDGINRHFNKLEFTLNDETDISNITLSFMNYNNNLDDGFNLFVTAEGIESYNTETIATKKSLTNRAYDCSEVDLLISNPIMDATPTSNLGKGFNYKLYSTTNENKVYLATTYNDISTNYAEVTSSDYYHAPCWIADEITYTGLENTLNKTYEYFIGLIQEPFSRSNSSYTDAYRQFIPDIAWEVNTTGIKPYDNAINVTAGGSEIAHTDINKIGIDIDETNGNIELYYTSGVDDDRTVSQTITRYPANTPFYPIVICKNIRKINENDYFVNNNNKRFVINSTASYNGSDYSLYSSTHDIKNVENDNDLLHWLVTRGVNGQDETQWAAAHFEVDRDSKGIEITSKWLEDMRPKYASVYLNGTFYKNYGTGSDTTADTNAFSADSNSTTITWDDMSLVRFIDISFMDIWKANQSTGGQLAITSAKILYDFSYVDLQPSGFNVEVKNPLTINQMTSGYYPNEYTEQAFYPYPTKMETDYTRYPTDTYFDALYNSIGHDNLSGYVAKIQSKTDSLAAWAQMEK